MSSNSIASVPRRRYQPSRRGSPLRRDHAICARVDVIVASALDEQAERHGVTPSGLASRLLEVVAKDDLWRSILEE